MPHTKLDVLQARPMAAALTRTARALDSYLDALRDAHKASGLTPEARAEILEAARHVHDAQHKLLRAVKMIAKTE